MMKPIIWKIHTSGIYEWFNFCSDTVILGVTIAHDLCWAAQIQFAVFVREPHSALADLSSLDRAQHQMRKLVGSNLYSIFKPLSRRRDVASFFYRYYFDRCFDGLHTWMLPTFVASRSIRRVRSPPSFCVPVCFTSGLFPSHLVSSFARQMNGAVSCQLFPMM